MTPSVYRIGGERILGNRPANDRMSRQPGFPGLYFGMMTMLSKLRPRGLPVFFVHMDIGFTPSPFFSSLKCGNLDHVGPSKIDEEEDRILVVIR